MWGTSTCWPGAAPRREAKSLPVMPCNFCLFPSFKSKKLQAMQLLTPLVILQGRPKHLNRASASFFKVGGGVRKKQWCSLDPLALESSCSYWRAPLTSQASLFCLFLFVVRSHSFSALMSYRRITTCVLMGGGKCFHHL